MYVSKRNLKFEGSPNNFRMQLMKMYREKDVPEWVKKSKNFKECLASGLIDGGESVVSKLDKSLVAEATSLGIDFDDSISQSVLEDTVTRVKQSKQQMLDEQASSSTTVIADVNSENSSKEKDSDSENSDAVDNKEEKRKLIEILTSNDIKANMTNSLDTLKQKVIDAGLEAN
jgi:hypothetical protein